jgi:hypothetical protein
VRLGASASRVVSATNAGAPRPAWATCVSRPEVRAASITASTSSAITTATTPNTSTRRQPVDTACVSGAGGGRSIAPRAGVAELGGVWWLVRCLSSAMALA